MVRDESGSTRRHRLTPCSYKLYETMRCFCSQRSEQSLVLCLPKEWDGEFASTAVLAVQTEAPRREPSCHSEGSAKTIVSPAEAEGKGRVVTVDVPDLPVMRWCSGSLTETSGSSRWTVQGTVEVPAE